MFIGKQLENVIMSSNKYMDLLCNMKNKNKTKTHVICIKYTSKGKKKSQMFKIEHLR